MLRLRAIQGTKTIQYIYICIKKCKKQNNLLISIMTFAYFVGTKGSKNNRKPNCIII